MVGVTVLRRPANRPDAQLLAGITRGHAWGVAELSAGRVAWARDAEAMSS